MALGPILMTFVALEIGLKFDGFSWLPWATFLVGGNTTILGPDYKSIEVET